MTKTPEEIIHALNRCIDGEICGDCPYVHVTKCRSTMHKDAADLILCIEEEGRNVRETSQDGAEMPEPWTREKVLAEAKTCVCGQREQDYGSPEDSFATIGDLWSVYLRASYPQFATPAITRKDVAMMMALLKVARIAAGNNPDNFVDLAGYAACGGEIAGGDVR